MIYNTLALAMALLSLPLKPTTAMPTATSLAIHIPRDSPSLNPWKIQVTLGKSAIPIGDITDGTYFSSLIQAPCGTTGCVPDDPQPFTAHIVKHPSGYSEKLSGQIVMTGDYNNFTDQIRSKMLDALSTALAKSIQCQSVKYTDCIYAAKRDPENGRAAQGCVPSTITQCTIADYVSAVAFAPDPNGAMEGSIQMSATSSAPQDLGCSTIIDVVAAALGPFDIAGFGAASGVATACVTSLGD